MFVDASVLVAILLDEDDAKEFSVRVEESERKLTSPVSIYEAALAVSRVHSKSVLDAEARVRTLLRLAEIPIEPVVDQTASLALEAHAKFGKGRHPARLNMGDCFAYAMAKQHGVPLLYKGADFSQTDLA
jgi:ribonuclease VapC